jgi:hypothetical protein
MQCLLGLTQRWKMRVREMAYGAALGGVGEAADARDALTGARAEEDELRLQPLALLLRRGSKRRTGDAAERARWKRSKQAISVGGVTSSS